MARQKRKRAKARFSLKEEYRYSFSYLSHLKVYLLFVILAFFLFAVIGFFFEGAVNAVVKFFFHLDLRDTILTHLQQLLLQTEGMTQSELTGYIFLNNLQSSFTSVVLGAGFGLFPLLTLVLNGYLLGFVSLLSVQEQGSFVLWRLLPHGIFELPAIFISLALGLNLGLSFFGKKKKYTFREHVWQTLRVFLLVVFPLLVVAALIEGALIALT